MPTDEDFNADLMDRGIDAVRRRLADQLLPMDVKRLIDIDGAAENDALQTSFDQAIP